MQRDNYLGKRNTSDYNQYIYGLNNPQMYKDSSGYFSIGGFFSGIGDALVSVGKAVVDTVVNVGKSIADFVNKNVIKPTIKFFDDVKVQIKNNSIKASEQKVGKAKQEEEAAAKARKVEKTKKDFQEYATKNGLEAAYAKYKNVDSQLLESMVQAYCDKLGLDYISINKALSSVAKVENDSSLAGKYTIICEMIKNTVYNVDASAIQSSVGYSAQSSLHKAYLSGAIRVLKYSRDLTCNLVWNLNSIQLMISSTSSSLSNGALKQEYSSSMIDHSSDMGIYINSKYILIKPWTDTGRYSGGFFTEQLVHKDSRSADAYGNFVYKFFVPIAAGVQENADKFEFVLGMVGAMNQSYNPYQSAGSSISGSKGSGGSDYAYKGSTPNTSTPNSNSGIQNGPNQPSYSQTSGSTNSSSSYTSPGSSNTRPGTSTYVPPNKGASVAVDDIPKRPSWQQWEIDAGDMFPGYDVQKSFLNGKEVPHGTKNSSRPEYYISGHSVEVKNYNIESSSGINNLANNVSKQVNQRVGNLPVGTKQTIVIDLRGQTYTNSILETIINKITEKCTVDVEIIFMK